MIRVEIELSNPGAGTSGVPEVTAAVAKFLWTGDEGFVVHRIVVEEADA